MSQILTFEYNSNYYPSAPFVDIVVDGYDLDKSPVQISAFVDSGADGTMLPYDVLQAIGAEYEDTVLLRGIGGGTQRLDRYTVRIHIGSHAVQSVSAVAMRADSESIVGRDVLNSLIVTLNGLAWVTEVLIE